MNALVPLLLLGQPISLVDRVPPPVPAFLSAPASLAIQQVGPDWQVTYSFPNTTGHPIAIQPADLSVAVSGWLSTSQVAEDLSRPLTLDSLRRPAPPKGELSPPDHSKPRWAAHEVNGSAGHASFAHLGGATTGDEADRCREAMCVTMWSTGDPPPDTRPQAQVEVPTDGRLNIRLTLRHDHESAVDALLGHRAVEMRVGPWTYRDTLPLDREQSTFMPDANWRPMEHVPEDHRDNRFFLSPPYSLRLDAAEPGNGYFRWPERRVRPGATVKISLRYFIPAGMDGRVRFRLAQYRERPNQWKVLGEGGWEVDLPGRGRWREFARSVPLEDEATTMALDVRVAEAEDGVAWVDDLRVEYVGVESQKP